MRISVEIDEAVLNDLMEITGEKNRSPAMAKAIVEFVRRKRASEFGRLIREGAFDYPDPIVDRDGEALIDLGSSTRED